MLQTEVVHAVFNTHQTSGAHAGVCTCQMEKTGRHDFSCGSVVNNFFEQMNRNCFDLVLARCNWNCSTMEDLKCFYAAINETILLEQSGEVARKFLTVF